MPAYAPWRQLTHGAGAVVIAVGSLAGGYIEAFERMSAQSRPQLWAVSELPLEHNPLPPGLLAQIGLAPALLVAEEHVRRSGFGAELALHLADRGIRVPRFHHIHARAHHYERYGSQTYLRRQSGLDVDTVLSALACA